MSAQVVVTSNDQVWLGCDLCRGLVCKLEQGDKLAGLVGWFEDQHECPKVATDRETIAEQIETAATELEQALDDEDGSIDPVLDRARDLIDAARSAAREVRNLGAVA